jgi:hypothetical protein
MRGPRSRYKQFVDFAPTKSWDGASSARRYPNGIYQTINHSIVGKEDLQITQGNPYHLLGKSNRALGGSFFVVKHHWGGSVIAPRPYSNSSNPYANSAHYDGPVYENTGYGVGNWPSPYYSTPSELDALGTTIIANVIPTNPVSGLFVSLGELKRDGIPSLFGVQSWKNRTNTARAAGSEYLNYQFGWLPLVNDMRKFTHAVRDSDELLAQYARNSGRKIKRSVDVPIDIVTTVSQGTGRSITPLNSAIYDTSSYGNYTQTVVKSKRRWFRAAFSYYLPPYKPNGDNTRRNEQLANYLYGYRPTPEGLWDLTPWTWAADWVGNFGDVLHNVGAFQQDGLVMLYGYVMEEGIHSITYSHPEVKFKTYPGVHEVSATVTTTVKQRRGATPYGFGLNPASFTGRQWAILAAIGSSRGNNKLYN